MLLSDSKEGLEKTIEKSLDVLTQYGLVVVRENLYAENIYWSQLPGNLHYACRKKPIITNRFAGLASISNYPAGKRNANLWGDAVSIFYTAKKTPYFFNFHAGTNGHTLIVGPNGAGKTVLTNFLVAQATKYNPQLFYLDFFNSSQIFIEALEGNYNNFNFQDKFFSFAFLKTDLDFFKQFLPFLLIQKDEISANKHSPRKDKLAIIENIINDLKTGSLQAQKLSDLKHYFANSPYEKIFALWIEEGKFAKIFDNDDENAIFKKKPKSSKTNWFRL